MIDVETLDTRPTAAVTQIGWCFFDACVGDACKPPMRSGGVFVVPSMDDRTSSYDTVKWWLGQSDAARSAFIKGAEKGISTGRAIDHFLNEASEYLIGDGRVWGCGSDFDLPIIADMAYKAGYKVPWKFWNHRCLRTLYELAGYSKADRTVPLTAHEAESDAVAQATDVVKIYKKLGLKR